MTTYTKGVPPTAARRVPPPFTEEHEELRISLRRWVEAELLPHADAWERERWFPSELFPRMGELGFLGLKYEEAYGGQGGGYLHDAILAEELARCGSGGVAAGLGAHITIATPPASAPPKDEGGVVDTISDALNSKEGKQIQREVIRGVFGMLKKQF
jgi:alkylation response protein AidB-like acyl-CoA dehydrogenase